MTPFDKFDQTATDIGMTAALEELADYLIGQNRFHELFEIRKLQLRLNIGLPLQEWQSIDELPESQSKQLEQGLLESCQEIGTLLVQSGDVHAGWQYLQPVGDKNLVRGLIHEVELTDENAEALIEIAVGNAVDPEFGFQIVLDRYGTCSAITTYESQLAMQPISVRQGPAKLLVEHVYDELMDRVTRSIEGCEESKVESARLVDLIADRDWLFEGLSHHIDTTHLASTIKLSRILDDQAAIGKAIELAEYGRRLHEDFHYADEPPFENIYEDTLEFLRALQGDEIEPATDRLRKQAESHIENDQNLSPAQWYVYLLDRLGKGREAVEAYLHLIQPNLNIAPMMQPIAPDLIGLAYKYRELQRVRQAQVQQGDLIGYVTAKAIENQELHFNT